MTTALVLATLVIRAIRDVFSHAHIAGDGLSVR